LQKLIDARRLPHEGQPAEPMHGQMPRPGIPRTSRATA
jgi:hydroxymethylglutaryl-CoA lyase